MSIRALARAVLAKAWRDAERDPIEEPEERWEVKGEKWRQDAAYWFRSRSPWIRFWCHVAGVDEGALLDKAMSHLDINGPYHAIVEDVMDDTETRTRGGGTMIPKHVTLSPHLVKFIERKATRDNTSFSEALRRVLDEYVDAVARGDIGGGKKE